jgi:acetolactate synthase-1/2/3 large subunit
MADERTGADILIETLSDLGVDVIFGYPGGAVLPIYDAIFQQNAIRHILVRHEQAAVHAAEGYARSTGKVGCVLVTSGPGATNAVTGLVDALMDSDPDRLPDRAGADPLIGNDAFQECDTVGITRPATKHNYSGQGHPQSGGDGPHDAFYVARSGRPGPVVIDLPKDILVAKGIYTEAPQREHRSYRPQVEPEPAIDPQGRGDAEAAAKRPVVYAGGGVINAGPEAEALLPSWSGSPALPITNTLMGLGCYPGLRSAMARHARHARHLRSQSGDAQGRRDVQHRRALRRPRDGPAECLLAAIR